MFQLPGEDESNNVAEKRADSPIPTTAEHEKSADHEPVLEATTTKSGERPESPSAIAPAQPRIYERYEVDAEVRSSYPPSFSINIAKPDLTLIPEILDRPLGHPARALPRPRPTPQARPHARHDRHPPDPSPANSAGLAASAATALPRAPKPLPPNNEKVAGAQVLYYFGGADVCGRDDLCVFYDSGAVVE